MVIVFINSYQPLLHCHCCSYQVVKIPKDRKMPFTYSGSFIVMEVNSALVCKLISIT